MDPNAHLGRRIGKHGDFAIFEASYGGEPCTVLRGRGAEEVASAHAIIDSPVVPRVLALMEDGVALEGAPYGTLDEVLAMLPKQSVPYEEGIVLTRAIARALADAHDKGVTAGAIGATNFLVLTDGTLRVIGFGAPRSTWPDRASCAPSVIAGRAPTPLTDLHAALLFMRSLVPWSSSVPAPLERLLASEPSAVEATFQRGLFRVLTLTGQLDGRRALDALTRFWRMVGVTPDEAALARRFVALRSRIELTVAADAEWFSVNGGERIDVARRRAVRLVLRALVEGGDAGCSVDTLVRAGWPGETLVGTSGPDRLYVALSSLRDLGLRDAIIRRDEGYALHPNVRIVRP